MTTIAELLREQSRCRGSSLAILGRARPPATYAELWDEVTRGSVTLRREGLGRRSRIAVSMANGPELATAVLAAASCATCVPLNPAYQHGEARFYLEDASVDALIVARGEHGPTREVATGRGLRVLELDTADGGTAGGFALPRRPGVDGRTAEPSGVGMAIDWPDADDVALILHTSGTTARPKIVPLTQANLLASAKSIAAHLALQPEDTRLNVLPLFHIHGLVASLLATLASGGSLGCTPGFDGEAFFEWVAEFQPTWYSAVPAIHYAVVANARAYRRHAPHHRFRFVRSSSAALPPSTLSALEATLDAPVMEAYGMTEASHQMTSNPLPPRLRKPGSVGLPAGVDTTIIDEAGVEVAQGGAWEIAIRGPGVTAGYENNPEANARSFTAGWFRTGDRGRLDEDGYLYISGRLKELVNRGGEKVWPGEVDEALLALEDVSEAAAFAVAHPSLGEDLVAAVVLKPGRQSSGTVLRERVFERLAAFKVPSQIIVVDAIPKGPTGKIQQTRLHEKLGPLLAQPFVAPGSETERAVEAVFRETLRCGSLGIQANFFVFGGDSLTGTRTTGILNERLSLDLPVTAIFHHPTISALAASIDTSRRATADMQAEIDAMSDEEVERMLTRLAGAHGFQEHTGSAS